MRSCRQVHRGAGDRALVGQRVLQVRGDQRGAVLQDQSRNRVVRRGGCHRDGAGGADRGVQVGDLLEGLLRKLVRDELAGVLGSPEFSIVMYCVSAASGLTVKPSESPVT